MGDGVPVVGEIVRIRTAVSVEAAPALVVHARLRLRHLLSSSFGWSVEAEAVESGSAIPPPGSIVLGYHGDRTSRRGSTDTVRMAVLVAPVAGRAPFLLLAEDAFALELADQAFRNVVQTVKTCGFTVDSVSWQGDWTTDADMLALAQRIASFHVLSLRGEI